MYIAVRPSRAILPTVQVLFDSRTELAVGLRGLMDASGGIEALVRLADARRRDALGMKRWGDGRWMEDGGDSVRYGEGGCQ